MKLSYWMDVGNPWDMLDANLTLMENLQSDSSRDCGRWSINSWNRYSRGRESREIR